MTNDLNMGSSPHTSPGKIRLPEIDISGPSPLEEGIGHSETIDQKRKSGQSSLPPGPGGADRRMLPNHAPGPLKKILLFLALLLGLYSLAGFFLAPYLLKTTLPAFLAKKLNRPVTIGSAKVNPYTLHITLKNGIIGSDLAVTDDKVDPVLSFGRMEGRINPSFFLKQAGLITAIRANSVFIHLTRQKDGRFNLTTLLTQLTSAETAFNVGYLAELVQTGDINLTDSRLIFTDQASDTQHTLEEISFSLPKRDNNSTPISPHFSAIIDGSPVSVGGQSESSASGQNTRLTFTLEKINLADYLDYLPQPFPGLVTKGEADVEILVDYRISPDKTYHFEISGSGIAREIWLHTPEKGENKIATASFFLRFDPILSQLTISKLILDQPEIQLQRHKDGTYIFPGAEVAKATHSDSTVTIETLVVTNGRLSYIDQKVPGGFGAIFNDINLSMDRGDKDDSVHAYALNCVTSRKTRIASQGNVALSKGKVDGLLILHNLPVAALNSYLPSEHGVSLSSGIITKAEASLKLNLHDPKNSIFTLSKLKGSATNLDIYYQGKEWLHIDQGLFTDVTLAADSSQIFLGNTTLSGLLGHFSPTDTRFLASLFSQRTKKGSESFAKLEVTNGTLLLRDFSFQKNPELPVKILDLQASGFGKQGDSPGEIQANLTLPQKGKCQLQGNLSLAPLTGTFQLAMQHVPLTIFAAKQMEWFAPVVQDGTIDFSGTFSLPHLSFRGRASLTDFLAHKKSTQEKLITIKKASTPQIHLDLDPFALQIDSLDLDALELFATLSTEVDSLSSLFFSTERSGTTTLGNMAVKKIALKNSALHFSDKTLNPPFSKSLSAIQGSFTDLANRPENSLTLDISGINEDQATLQAKGSINLFADSLGADFSVSLLEQPLDPFIPYLEPMVGHSLSGGIFDFAVSYKESAGKVNTDTVLTLRHLTLGNQDLGNRQFPTTVALVTDNEQIIRLAIPIIGDMTDPSYTFHSAYGKKLRSLISKASVSPFSMLTEFYDQEQPAPDHVLFEAGDTTPTLDSQRQLVAIKNILLARPLLTLTLKGYSAGSEDRDALLKKKTQDEQKKRLALQNSMSDDFIVSYGQEEITMPPALPPGATATILTVSKEELLALARERCLRLKDILIEQYGVEGSRIHISPDATVVPESGAGLAGNRADFILGRSTKDANEHLP